MKVIVFPGGFNWPIFVAQDKGFFDEKGVSVEVTPTPDSKFQMKGLIDGEFDIAMTAMDNVVAYSEGQGAVETENEADIFAFMGVDNGFLRLVSVPDVKTYDDIKGKQVGVDALTTGYAFVLRKMLELNGLSEDDFEFVEAGGVMSRFGSLMEKKFAATLLVSPLEAAAERQGFNLLGNGSETLGAYQGVVGAARRDWASENEDDLVGYIGGYRAALDWLYDPANKDEAIAILEKHVPQMAGPVAQVSYKILLDDQSGFFKDGAVSPEGVQKVLELRSEYGQPQKDLTDPAKYTDTSYYEKTSK
ncbi:ABC transporter substrate-binding protein [Jiella avicenniae]|uniref:ABC transporter substrate-binding protein n=1 Tax=Jiella avicenniae TaxID=2907202 RepID=A0A9X1T603_9HYPH|nr:ABC transporter substrate-binding protein [Jiella avicenniae]MCE7029394.1 ABC transporter substrate-binding protein [Jiella avicenniae]